MSYALLLFFSSLSFIISAQTTSGLNKTNPLPRVVALSPHLVEILYSIGAGDQIVGASEFSDYPEQAKKIERVGNYLRLQLERIVELNPDYILAWRNGSPSDDLAKLKSLGFSIIYSEPKTFTDIANDVKRIGKLTGHLQQSEQLAEQFLQRLQAIKQHYQQNKPLLGFYELWHQPLQTIAKNSWPQQHLDICGVKNPFYDLPTSYPQISIERVLTLPIQLIITPHSANSANKQGFPWQQWPHLPAVKNNKILHPDADKMHRMTLRALDELESFCANVEQVRQFYQRDAHSR
jgi:vitamin B12 transport system substrate-binding protein